MAESLLLPTLLLRLDHIPSAQEGLGPTWWGILLMALVAMGFVGAILVAVRKVLRAESEAPDV